MAVESWGMSLPDTDVFDEMQMLTLFSLIEAGEAAAAMLDQPGTPERHAFSVWSARKDPINRNTTVKHSILFNH